MVFGPFQKMVVSGIAAAAAAGASLVSSAAVAPPSAYQGEAVRLEAAAASSNAARIFNRADLDNNGYLGRDEYEILSLVTAELTRLNGFIALDAGAGVETVVIAPSSARTLDKLEKARIKNRAQREFALYAGDDERLASDEYVNAYLEMFLATDVDRNGVLVGAELLSFAHAQSKLSTLNS